ncbi:MAG: hypothetical protein GEU74_01560 [Nitriliruptorales bacterium]|nr:hypothetical protein [Nitriliruptorales bacterium]
MAVPSPTSEQGGTRRAAHWVGLGLHVLVGFFPYLSSGLLVPPWGLVVLALVWLSLLVAAWRWRPANPWAVLIVPVVAAAAWFAIVSLGEALFGWTG